jgi:uncharacterized membrane protein YtjA (UPF0391 family)
MILIAQRSLVPGFYRRMRCCSIPPVDDDRVTVRRHCNVEMGAHFFVVAIIAALFGFTGIAAGAAEIAKILFFLFLVLCAVFLALAIFTVDKLR